MANKSRQIAFLMGLIIIPPLIILLSRQLFSASYLNSSIYKLIFLVPILYRVKVEGNSLWGSFKEHFSIAKFKKNFLLMLAIGGALGVIYLLSFYIFKDTLNLDFIASKLKDTAGITTTNLVFIGAYIIILNSLFEEFFWRGFLFDKLVKTIKPWATYLITGLAFSFHHLVFYYNWFSLGYIVLVTLGLTVFSIIMNLIFQKYKDLFSCWLIHAMADTVQIYIGLKIFGIF